MMKSFEELKFERITEILNRADEFDFCELLTLLRAALNMTRVSLSKETNLPDWLLYNWESGRIIRPPKYEHLVTLADYFGISPKLLKEKAREFSMERKKCI